MTGRKDAHADLRVTRRRRRWWQRVIRAGVALLVLAAALYATLPWWAPTGLLARRLAEAMSQRLGLPVQIKAMRLSWGDGVSVSGLRIRTQGPPGGERETAVVGLLRCELAPFRLLTTGRPERVEMFDVELDLRPDEHGRSTLAPLLAMSDSPPPEHLAVHRAAVTLRLPAHPRELRLKVSDLQYQAGRLEQVGRVSLSAALVQDGADAPMTLMGTAGAAGRGPAEGSFRLSGVRLAQLRLPALLGLPLERLAGSAGGRLDCRVNKDQVVEDFTLQLRVDGLDAQPRAGPALPAVPWVELHLAGSMPPGLDGLGVRELRLRGPGVDLAGSGHFDRRADQRGWESVGSLEFALVGQVDPAKVPGGPERGDAGAAGQPGTLDLAGPVKVDLKAQVEESRLSIHAALDAAAVEARRGGRTLKPAGRAMSARLSAGISLGPQPAEAADGRLEITLGRNAFRAGARAPRTEELAARWRELVGRPGPEAAAGLLSAMDFDAACEVVELDSVRELLGEALPGEAALGGPIEAEVTARRGETVRLAGRLRLPRDAAVSAGRWLQKPAGLPGEVEFSAAVAPDARTLGDVHLQATLGEGVVTLEKAALSLATVAGREGSATRIRAEGKCSAKKIEALLACVPAAPAGWRIAGAAGGSFRADALAAVGRFHLEADATALEAAEAGGAFAKSAGQRADLIVDLLTDGSAPAQRRHRLEAIARLAGATLAAEAAFPPAWAKPRALACRVSLSVPDARGLLAHLPRLRQSVAAMDPQGSLSVQVQGRIGEEGLSGELSCNADGLQFLLPARAGPPRRTKPRGQALRLSLVGRASGREAEITRLAAEVGRSSLEVEGTAGLSAPAEGPAEARPAGVYWPPPGVTGVKASYRGQFELDAAARALLPELADWARQRVVAGPLRLAGEVRGDEKSLNVDGRLDATDLAVRSGEHFHKPAGATAAGRFALVVPPDLAEVRLKDLFVEVGGVQLRAGGTWPVVAPGRPRGHVALSAPDLAAAAALAPSAAPYQPAGGIFVEAEIGRGGADLDYLTLTARDALAEVRGKKCRLDGRVSLTDVVLSAAASKAGRVATESLSFAVGENRGHVVADLGNVPAAPAGQIEIICESLDTLDLQRWLDPAVTAKKKAPLTAAEKEALRKQADALIASAAPRLRPVDVNCRARIDRLRYFDSAVEALYDVRAFDLAAEAKAGVVTARCRYGVNGGLADQRCRIDLAARPATVEIKGELRELLAGENLRAALAREFPGNTWQGTFSRSEDLRYSLSELVMQSLDQRYWPIAVGSAVTTTHDGTVRGQAGPEWLARIFPGLKLTTYKYRRMVGRAELLPGGTARNDMVFDGVGYDIYMNGTTDVDRNAVYTVGVILFGQVRSPIFDFRGRIVGDQFVDVKVSYTWPTETAYRLFLKGLAKPLSPRPPGPSPTKPD